MRQDLVLEDMHCEHCASNIERYLAQQPHIRHADVDYGAGRARLEVEPEGDVAAIVDALESMGYGASLVDP